MADVTEIIDYYMNLLIIQYHNKPNAQATIEALIKEAVASGVYFDVRDGYNLDTAVGVQLDVIGKYVGIDRNYQGIVFGDGFFAFVEYPEIAPYSTDKRGFTDYSSFEAKKGSWLNYPNSLSNDLVLNDDDYKILIKLKIIQNNSNHSHKSIDDSLFNFFGTGVRADSDGKMIMFYFIPDALNQVLNVALQKNVLPRPMGVQLQYALSSDATYFGMATYSAVSSNKTGFANYTDFETKVGSTLNYDKLIEV